MNSKNYIKKYLFCKALRILRDKLAKSIFSIWLYGSIAIIIILFICSCSNVNTGNEHINPRLIIWGENSEWEKLDNNIISYYFVGYISESFQGVKGGHIDKFECAYIRPRKYFIKHYTKIGNSYLPTAMLYSDDDIAWIYSYHHNKIFEQTEERYSFNFEPQMQMTYLGESELNQVFNCMETRFPLPPKFSESKGKISYNQHNYDVFYCKLDSKFGRIKYSIESDYLMDPSNKWPKSIRIRYIEKGRFLILKSPLYTITRYIPFAGKRYEHQLEIYYENIEYNISENFIKEKFITPQNIERANIYNDGKLPYRKRLVSPDIRNRFEKCKK